MSINGMDCQCAAQHEGQCSCGCDWTTPKEARLEALNAELLAACKEAVAEFDTGWFAQGKSIIVAAIENMEGK